MASDGQCPVHKQEDKSGVSSNDAQCPSINPLTNLPHESLLQAGSSPTATELSTARTTSTIPRTDTDNERWLYPSPRMFYNALSRKGYETDPHDVGTMVDMHNFLNEAVWQEILKWEGLHKSKCGGTPSLKRFLGRPKDLSPKAWVYSKIWRAPPPFDRHDWTIDRCGMEVRYVIDYYLGHPEANQAVFNVDVRPALDSPVALWDRIRMFSKAFIPSQFNNGGW